MKNEDHVSLTKYSGTIEIKYQFYNNYRNHAHSLTNFYCQYADRHKFEILATCQRVRAGNLKICYRKKQIDVSF